MANFGSSSFACDVASLETDALQLIQESVQQTQVPFPVQVRDDVPYRVVSAGLTFSDLCNQSGQNAYAINIASVSQGCSVTQYAYSLGWGGRCDSSDSSDVAMAGRPVSAETLK